jgi:hypothetical protein
VCGLVPPTWDGVTEAAQVAAFPPLGASVQAVKASPVVFEESAIVPWGLLCGLDAVSVTVTVTVLACPTTTEVGFSVTVVVVVRTLTFCVSVDDVLPL